jgi:rhodanese-related sulfurtransferase
MFGFGKTKAHREIDAQTLRKMLADGSAVIVDVREPDEFAAKHIRDVLQCAGGNRSGLALDRCASAQSSIDTHLAGGIGAWKAAGLPVERG